MSRNVIAGEAKKALESGGMAPVEEDYVLEADEVFFMLSALLRGLTPNSVTTTMLKAGC
jgi:hypothetical protein